MKKSKNIIACVLVLILLYCPAYASEEYLPIFGLQSNEQHASPFEASYPNETLFFTERGVNIDSIFALPTGNFLVFTFESQNANSMSVHTEFMAWNQSLPRRWPDDIPPQSVLYQYSPEGTRLWKYSHPVASMRVAGILPNGCILIRSVHITEDQPQQDDVVFFLLDQDTGERVELPEELTFLNHSLNSWAFQDIFIVQTGTPTLLGEKSTECFQYAQGVLTSKWKLDQAPLQNILLSDILQCDDGLLFCGTKILSDTDSNIIAYKMTFDGQLEWFYEMENDGSTYGRALAKTDDGTVLVGGGRIARPHGMDSSYFVLLQEKTGEPIKAFGLQALDTNVLIDAAWAGDAYWLYVSGLPYSSIVQLSNEGQVLSARELPDERSLSQFCDRFVLMPDKKTLFVYGNVPDDKEGEQTNTMFFSFLYQNGEKLFK